MYTHRSLSVSRQFGWYNKLPAKMNLQETTMRLGKLHLVNEATYVLVQCSCVYIYIYIHTHIEVDRYRYASPNTCSYLWLSMYIFILYFTHCIPLTKRLQWHQSWRVLGTSWSCSSPDRLTAATSSTAADSWWNQSGLFKTFTWDSHLKLGIDKLYKRSATLL